MGVTIPDNIPFPDAGTALPPLETHFAAVAEGAQQAVNNLRTATSPAVASEAARNTLYSTAQQGNSVWRLDRGYEERYFSEYSASANPGGASPAGWYPVNGAMPFASIFRSSTTASIAPGGWVAAYQSQYWAGGSRSPDFAAYNNGWTIPLTGLWEVEAMVSLNTTANTMLTLSLNGSTITVANQILTASGAGVGSTSAATIKSDFVFSANDMIRPFIYHSSTGSPPWSATANGARPEVNGRMILRYLGPTR